MKLLIVVPALGQVYGGPSKIALELADALSRQNTNVDLVTTNANGNIDLDVPLQTWLPTQSYRIQYFPHLGLGDYKISGSLTWWLFKHIKDYDLVHTIAVFSYPIAVTHWLCQRYNIPYIMNPQGMLEPWALSYKAWKKRLFYALFEKAALKNAGALHMLSSSEAQRIERLHLKTPIVIVPNGLHRQDYETLSAPDRFYHQFPETKGKTLLLFLGRIDPKKGLDLLALAFASVHQQFPNTHLVVAGQDNIDFLSTAKNYFAQANCLKATTFTGMLSGKLKYAALGAADLYVAPSYSEGFSMSVLEGMASGLPCVITTGCNFPEASQVNAAKVVDIRADAIATALFDCLSDPLAAKAMGDRARQFVLNQYSWDRIAVQLFEVYTAILGKNSANNAPS